MAIRGFSNSRNLPARKRVQKRSSVRKALLETLEPRQLLAVGPQLIGVQPNTGDLLQDGEVLNVAPRELVFRFNDGAGIDPNSLGGIRVIRSGEDGVFERASVASDLGTSGQTLVEFYAQTPGQAGNGIELRFTAVSRTDTRLPILRVSGRRIDVELNSNPALETRVEDLLRVFERSAGTPATQLVYALPLRGSQTLPVGRTIDTTRSLVLSGANATKGSTNLGLGNTTEVRFVSRDSGSAGLGIVVNITRRDPGGAAPPTITVNGKTINVELNSNPRFATTVREMVDAINASAASSLIEAQLVSGVGAARVGSGTTPIPAINLTGVSDIEILPAYIGLGDSDREVVLRFGETLPDDNYRIEILGQGVRTLRNLAGEPFNAGNSSSIAFELDLGVQVLSIVPQPVTRNPSTGALSWDRNSEIDVYLTRDKLIDVRSIVSVNGLTISQLTAERGGILYLQNSDSIVFANGGINQRGVLDPQFYQLINSKGTLNTTDDDAAVLPTRIRYYPDADRVSLRYARSLDEYTTVGGELRLRIGTNEPRPLPPTMVDGLSVDPADTFGAAKNLGQLAGNLKSLIIDSEIRNTTPLLLDFPGGSNEPGNRTNRFQDNLRLGADSEDGTTVITYNFQGSLGVSVNNTPIVNAITEQQKQRVREVLSIYEQYLGVRFVESANVGLTIAVGDTRAVVPFEDVVGGGISIIDINGPGVIYYESGQLAANGQPATVLDIQDFSQASLNEFNGPFQRAVMQGIGRLLGLGLADEAADLTIQSFASAFLTPGVGTEIVLPGDVDIVHGQYLYRPDSKDIDLYQFTLPVSGRISIEAFAERMSSASLLDSQIRLFQQIGGGWEEIAANNDYFSSDSFLELDLSQGNYIVGVSAAGNDSYDPTIGDTGLGGRSQGRYQLRMDFQPPAPSVLRDADSVVGTEFDGDADGTPGGVQNFWFRPSSQATTKFVDKSAPAGGNGSLAAPFNNIGTALAAASAGNVVRVLGNGGADKNFATQTDNLAYEIGFDNLGRPLADGATLDVPKNVSLAIDAGAILKLRRARVGVGSTSVNVDRSGGALLVLGTPTLQTDSGQILRDAAGAALPGSVFMTSWNDASLGKNTTASTAAVAPGDWGGIDIRNRVDTANGRNQLDSQGIFLNWVSNADLRFGGGQVVVDGTSQSITPVQMVDSRPTIVSSSITRSADAAMSATPNSFRESNFHSPQEQGNIATPFTVDYDRVGPDIHGNRILNNSINGLQVRARTAAPNQLEKMTVQGRFDDTDIVHVLPENLEIQGTPGGATLKQQAPSTTLVQLTPQVGGTLPTGFYNYRFTSIDANGVESIASDATQFTFVSGTTHTIAISSIPASASRIYRSANGAVGPYVLVGELSSSVGTFIDTGTDLGIALPTSAPAVVSRLDARLVIDSGTIIKSQGARIDVGIGAQLIAEGTDGDPVVFTSLNDVAYGAGGTFNTANRAAPPTAGARGAAAGDWGGIYVGHTASASIDNAVIAFGGGTTRVEGGFADFAAIEAHQADLRVAHSRIEFNSDGFVTSTDPNRGGRGINTPGTIFVRGAQPVIVDNLIADNQGAAISINVSSLNSTSVQDRGRSTGRIDVTTNTAGNQGPLIAKNRLDNNGINGMIVRPGNVTTESVWDDTSIVHVVQGEIVVPDFQHYGGLRLTSSSDQSLVVKLSGAQAGFRATGEALDNANRIGGSIQVIGTPQYPVVLTSLADDSFGAGFTPDGNQQVDTNNDGNATSPTAGSWAGIRLETFSNDRNVAITKEGESPIAGSPAANNTPQQAQFLGNLAPNEKAGDENRRLGYQLNGVISAPGDVDVYSFQADAGTEVWLDIDRTNNSLDTVIELVDANGRTLALSDNSLAEEANPSQLFRAAELAAQSVNPLRKSSPAFYFSSAQGAPKDLYSTNPRDAGMRIVLPGETGSNNLYHIRVRSSNVGVGDPASKLLDPARLNQGLTTGHYQLQIRLGEVDEIPGSGISYATIRHASTGISLVGVPGNSPLLGENSEIPEVGPNAVQNDTIANAQALGNLLATNRQAISVAGNIDDFTDVDWFSFDLTYEKITPVQLREYFATVIDVDYADGIGRPDVSLYVFNSAGNLILGGLGSDLVSDQSSPGAGNSELSRGSAGILDPFIGPYELPTETQTGADIGGNGLPGGRYFLAVTNSDMVPALMASFTHAQTTGAFTVDPLLRVQPIEGVQLIAEDHIETQGSSTAVNPVVPILFPTAGDFDGTTFYDATNDSIVDYTLSDIVMYVSQDVGREQTNIYIVNPFTGEVRGQVGRVNQDIQDLAFRPNGTLQAFDRTIEAQVAANVDRDGLSDYFTIDPGTAVATDVGDLGLQTTHYEFGANNAITVAASDDGFNVEAITFAVINNQERGILVGSRPTPPGQSPQYYQSTRFINNMGQPGFDRPGPSYFSNVIYEFDENTGAAISNPANDKQNLAVGLGAGTAVQERGYIETFTVDINGNIVSNSDTMVTREVTRGTNTGPQAIIRDGDIFVILDSNGVQRRFEFDLGPQVLVNYNPAAGRGVTDGMKFTLDGQLYEFDTEAIPNVTSGAIRIPISPTATLRQFVDAIAENVTADITVSFDSGRMNFSGATNGFFTDLVNAGIFSTVANVTTPGTFAVRILASDTAEAVAQRVAQTINAAAIPDLLAVTTGTGDRVQLSAGSTFLSTGPLAQFGIAPGGIVTGIAVIGNTMYAVSDAGGFYRVDNPIALRSGNVATYVDTSYDLVGINFTGLVAGPVHAQNGQLSQILFGIDSGGNMHAIDAATGRLMPVFANGATSVSTGLFNANGLTMPSLDFNLWHVTGQRNTEPGHGLPATPNNSRAAFNGGQSLYFGFQSPATNGTSVAGGLGDLTGPNATGLNNSYNFPGGAAGAIESAPIDLSGITAGALPTLYFTYRFETEQARADLPRGTNAQDYMRDSLRVYASGENGEWILLATNNEALPEPNVTNRGEFDDEFDYRLTGNRETQELFDNNGQWRQARVPLDVLAGRSNVKIRVEFSSNGGFGYGLTGGRGPEIRTISGDRLVDGETLILHGTTFEIEMGASLTLPGGRSLSNGASVTIEGRRYVFTDGTLPVTAPDVPVNFSASMSAAQVALQLQSAIQNATPLAPSTTVVNFGEGNDTIGKASATGLTGDTASVIINGEIGDNPTLANFDEDVDLFRVDLDKGGVITVDAKAIAGSSLDTYLRLFDADGRSLVENNNIPGGTDSRLTFTAPASGRYYVGVSGFANSTYNAAVAGTAKSGSTGQYNLTIAVQRPVTPIVAGNRLQLVGAKNVSLPTGSAITLQGGLGSNGQGIEVRVDMSAAEVAAALQQSIADFFAGGATSVYTIRGGDTIDLTGLIDYNSFDFFTGLPVPSASEFAPGPFGATTNFVGDAFSAFNTGTNFDGTTNNARPGALGAQANAFDGVYLDDFIIGIAGRGEMFLNSNTTDTTFVRDPQDDQANPSQANADQEGVEITVGPYQFEIRGGSGYGVPLLPGPVTIALVDADAPDALLGAGTTIRFNAASSLVAGDTFTLSDGTTVLTFEMDDVNDGRAVQPGNIPVTFNTAAFDPTNGSRSSESAQVIAARVRDIINSAEVQAQFNVSANLLNNDRGGATSDTVVLIGQASANLPSSVGQVIVSQDDSGVSNRERPQGQIVINAVTIENSANFGAQILSADRDPTTNAPLPGSPRNTVTLNSESLAPGAVIMNSQFLFNAAGGISVNGTPTATGVPAAAVPFVRLVNNTIVGGTVTGDPGSEVFTAGGEGIVVANNATATLLNNVIVNSTTGINVNVAPTVAATVIGGTVYHRNTTNVAPGMSLGQFPLVIAAGEPMFTDVAAGNLYPAAGSRLIDSSIDSLLDRPSLVAVKEPLGIARSPILAPQFDINGQLRVDDPNVETPAGLGENVFKDRGAQDRADFTGPSLVLVNPVDNDFEGVDTNPALSIAELTGITPKFFDIQIVDGLEPSDPDRGSGVDDSTVNSSSVLVLGPKVDDTGVRRQNQPLVEGQDYRFGYDSTNGIIRLTPLAGIWEPESVYTIRFLNKDSFAVVGQASYSDGDQFRVVDSSGSSTTFELDFGYRITVPDPASVDLTTLDGRQFAIDDGTRRVVFEVDTNGSVSSGTIAVNLAAATTAEAVGRVIQNAVQNTGLNLTISEIAAGQLQIQGTRLVRFEALDSGLSVVGATGVQTAFGLQIPLRAGQPFGVTDGQTFTITRSNSPVTFEFDTNGVTQPGNTVIRTTASATTAELATAIVNAIVAANQGLTPVHAGNGLILLGGDAGTQLNLSGTVLTQSGVAGQPAAIPISLSAANLTSEGVAGAIEQAIDAQNLPGVVTTLIGTRVLIEGASSVTGVGASSIAAIRDLAGNPLKANRVDGTAAVTIFLGEGLDYGDAPAPYASLSSDNGPRHTVVAGLSLGTTVSTDADAKLPNLDDDDGVTFSSLFAAFQASATINVRNTTGQSAFVSMWVDFNGNGTFETSERILNSRLVNSPTTPVTFTVPPSTFDSVNPQRTKLGNTYARVRVSTNASAVGSPVGAAPDGEVEDYVVNIQGNPFNNSSGIVDAFGNGLDVSGDGFVSPIDVLQVINWINDPTKPDFLSLANATGNPPFIDVNGDGLVSGADVNIIITFLNSIPPSGEGEGESSNQALDLLSSGEDVVLSSDWAAGLETILMKSNGNRQSEQPMSANDIALLQSDDDSDLAFSTDSQMGTVSDSVWAEFNSNADSLVGTAVESSLLLGLGDELFDELFGGN